MAPSRTLAERAGLSDPHVLSGLGYCEDVVAGKIPAGKLAKAACARQLRDLERWISDPSWPYEFDEDRAGRICRFIEQLPHIKGDKGGTLIELEPWQCFTESTIFGWVRKDSGKRRFRRAYREVARGNAKSTIAAGEGLYLGGCDGENGAEVVIGATTRDQAEIIVNEVAKPMLRRRPLLAKRIGFTVDSEGIKHKASDSQIEALSRDAKVQDGRSVSGAILDEVHAWRDRALYEVIETGTSKRSQSLLSVITTGGTDTSGICYELRGYAVKVLLGEIEDEAQFAIIYTADLDSGDDWTDAECIERTNGKHDWHGCVWRKANPNFGISVDVTEFSALARKAMQIASARPGFLTKHLNQWMNADHTWMDMDAWDRCADASLRAEDFAEEPCWIGLDLASVRDLACRARLFARDLPHRDPELSKAGETERHWYAFVDSYLPEATLNAATNASYPGWAATGKIRITPRPTLDFGVIEDDVAADLDRHDVKAAPYDPWQALQLAGDLAARGAPMVEYRPTTANYSPPMKKLEAVVLDGTFHHDGNPCLRWMISNVVCHEDAAGNVYPRKEREDLKIDGPVALISALGVAMHAKEEAPPRRSYVESGGGILVLA